MSSTIDRLETAHRELAMADMQGTDMTDLQRHDIRVVQYQIESLIKRIDGRKFGGEKR